VAEKDQEKKPEVSEKEKVTAEKNVDQDTAKKEPEKKQSSEETDEETEKKLSDLQKKYDELEDKYLRAEAEMQNMTKRFKKEQQQLLKYEGQDLIREILPVVDNLNRALQIDVKESGSEQLKRGIEMVQRDMEKALKDNDVTKIEALGQTFDPTLHQAVKAVPVEEGQKAETIVEVYQDGYMLKDRVLRPAMVVVAQ
jgi:molecular chaperone GrpE